MSEFNIDIIDNNLYFTGDIQPDSYHRFATVLHELENRYSSSVDKSVNLHLFSDGGRVDSGLAIHDLLKRSTLDITVVCTGYVASSGITVMCAVDKRVSLPNTTFLIHPINYGGRDTLPNNEATYKYAKLLDNMLFNITSKCGITRDMESKETYLTAAEALEIGLITEII